MTKHGGSRRWCAWAESQLAREGETMLFAPTTVGRSKLGSVRYEPVGCIMGVSRTVSRTLYTLPS